MPGPVYRLPSLSRRDQAGSEQIHSTAACKGRGRGGGGVEGSVEPAKCPFAINIFCAPGFILPWRVHCTTLPACPSRMNLFCNKISPASVLEKKGCLPSLTPPSLCPPSSRSGPFYFSASHQPSSARSICSRGVVFFLAHRP